MRIGLFDSGVGGLSVLRHLYAELPQAHYLYVADNAYAPYGGRSNTWIAERSLQLAQYLEARGVDVLLIACHTATAHAVEVIRASLKIPVVAIEPAIKPAIALSQTRKIAVLATAGTLASPRFHRLKDTLGPGYEYLERACHHWVEAVEKDPESAEAAALVADELKPLIAHGVDTFVLACTHFPFLARHFTELLPAQAHVIDPSMAVVKQLRQVLDGQLKARSESGVEAPCPVQVETSAEPASVAAALTRLASFPVQVERLPAALLPTA